MVAPKVESGKYELSIKDEIQKEEEEEPFDEDLDKPLTQEEFKKMF
jgi:hypothetical protein